MVCNCFWNMQALSIYGLHLTFHHFNLDFCHMTTGKCNIGKQEWSFALNKSDNFPNPKKFQKMFLGLVRGLTRITLQNLWIFNTFWYNVRYDRSQIIMPNSKIIDLLHTWLLSLSYICGFFEIIFFSLLTPLSTMRKLKMKSNLPSNCPAIVAFKGQKYFWKGKEVTRITRFQS